MFKPVDTWPKHSPQITTGFACSSIKAFLLCLLVPGVILPVSLVAQNLVPNASFDHATSCPRTEGEVDLAIPWLNTQLTPDLFLRCAENENFKVPTPRKCTYLEPHSGDGYVGLATYGNTREVIGVPLIRPLEKGKSYFLQFWVAIDDVCDRWDRGTYTDAIGLGFGEDNYDIPEYPALEHRGTIFRDTAGWTPIFGCYIANGKEKYLFIKNFQSDDHTLAVSDDPALTPVFDYMYIDDVAVIPMNPYPDTLPFCGSPILLEAAIPDATYLWDNNSTDSIRWVHGAGNYRVTIKLGSCEAEQFIHVVDVDHGFPENPDVVVCKGNAIRLQTALPGSVTWEDGTSGGLRTIDMPGIYQASITNECGLFTEDFFVTAQDCGCQVEAPNVFSPNGDQINDTWKPFLDCPSLERVELLQIFDRWGQLIFASSDPDQLPWDGRFHQSLVPPGIYLWLVTYRTNKAGIKSTEYASGDLTVIR